MGSVAHQDGLTSPPRGEVRPDMGFAVLYIGRDAGQIVCNANYRGQALSHMEREAGCMGLRGNIIVIAARQVGGVAPSHANRKNQIVRCEQPISESFL